MMTASGTFGGDINKDICVPTIMHSGTHLLRYVILKGQGKNEQDVCLYGGESGRRMCTFHMLECDRHANELQHPLFTSLRHPRRIAESFRRRREAGGIAKNHTEESFDYQWRQLIDNISKRAPIYVHVDHPIRDKEVNLIAKKLNLPIKADWSVNKDSGSVAGTHDIDIDDCPEVPQEYIDFYFDTIKEMEAL